MADNIPRTSPQAYVPKRLAQGWFALDSKSTATCQPSSDSMNAVEASPSAYTAGGLVIIPRGTEHEAWFREDTEVIDFFAPPRDDFLLGGKPAYMSED